MVSLALGRPMFLYHLRRQKDAHRKDRTMTINDLINKLATIATTYGDDAEIETVTLLEGDWLTVSGWATDRDGEDVEIEECFK